MYLTIENRHTLEDVNYSDLFSNVSDQLRITEAFQVIIDAREKIRDAPRLPGHRTGPREL